MDGQYLLAICEGKRIYAMHDKVYSVRKQADNALKIMQANGKLTKHYKVYQLAGLKDVN